MCGNRHDLEVIGLVRRTRFGLFRCDKVLKAVPPWKRNAAVSNVIPRGNRSRRMKIFAVCGTAQDLPRMRGSSTSRKASPTRFQPITNNTNVTPGQTTMNQ